jgi:hypothetical protein
MPQLPEDGKKHRNPPCEMSKSEIITILLLHLVCNEKGELLSFCLPPGNVDDRNPETIKTLTKKFFGKLFGDRGYISSSLFELLFNDGI